MQIKKVNRHTRAGITGKRIICPECLNTEMVYHFAWYSVKCIECFHWIRKDNVHYLIKQGD